MGRLFFNETGRVLPHEAEPITRWRHAQVDFRLPEAARKSPADLWLCLGCDSPSDALTVEINGHRHELRPRSVRLAWQWRRVQIPQLRSPDVRVVVRSNSRSMSGWMLALDASGAARHSQVSDDAGRSWRSEQMGLHSALCGEYLVRLRVPCESIPAPRLPAIAYEDPKHPKVRSLLERVPANVRAARDPWTQLLRLRSWVARQWPHVLHGPVYAPWDPATVLDWTRQARRGKRPAPTTICVHYGAVFAALAAALGHRARCVAMTADLSGPFGHFVAEVFDQRQGGWVQHDPNLDLHYERADGRRLSATELCDRSNAGQSLRDLARFGQGTPASPRRIVDFLDKHVLEGTPFRHVAFWARNDYISSPQIAPCHHGPMCYTETNFLWYSPGGDGSLDMFPYVTTDHRPFATPPKDFGR